MIKWKNENELTLQLVENDKVVKEIKLDMLINPDENKDNIKNKIISQLNKQYSNGWINFDKDSIEMNLYINEYCIYSKTVQ